MGIYLHIAARTDRGRARPKNEDAFVAVDFTGGETSSTPIYRARFAVGDRGALVALSDGMGGAKAGEVASALVLSSLTDALSERASADSPRQVVVGAVAQAHEAVWS